MDEDIIVISLGGSLIVPNNIDIDFLNKFKDLIIKKAKKGKKFIIVTGGGKICRKYQNTAKKLSNPSHDDLDYIGIASLKLNAELLRVIFGDLAHNKVIENLSLNFPFKKPIVIGSAYKPGQSTDYDAVLGAKKVGSKKIINLSNIDYLFDKDPNENNKAKKIKKISWQDYRKMIPKEWSPGLSSPFDPIASKLAEEENIKVFILNGSNIDNLEKCLENKKFEGTEIS